MKWNENYTDPSSDIARFYVDPVTPGTGRDGELHAQAAARGAAGHEVGVQDRRDALVRRACRLGHATNSLADYLSAKIWAPYGMEQTATWMIGRQRKSSAAAASRRRCATTHDSASSCSTGAASMAARIVPDGWFEEATRKYFDTSYPDRGYGYQWWTLPGGTFAGIGIHGQLALHRSQRGTWWSR